MSGNAPDTRGQGAAPQPTTGSRTCPSPRSGLDTLDRSFDQTRDLAALDEFEAQALALLTNPQTKVAFDLTREDARIRTGRFVGATDKRGEDSIDRVCGPGDFLATIYHHLGIDYARTFIKDFNGRPTAIVDHGRAIPELIS